MISTPYRAFGYIVIKDIITQDEKLSDDELFRRGVFTVNTEFDPNLTVDEYKFGDYNHIWLYTSGQITHTNIYTGDASIRREGYNTLDTPEVLGIYKITCEEDAVAFCISPAGWNSQQVPMIPNVTIFKLLAGESSNIVSGTKLFLASGEFESNGIVANTIGQITFSSNKTINAITNCYGFIFN